MNYLQPKSIELLTKFRAIDGHENPPGYQYFLKKLFQDVQLQDRSVLEIGSGRGLISLHCATQGASSVVSMEPEMEGSTGGVTDIQQQRIQQLGLEDRVELVRQNFHDAVLEKESFDVIVMIAVLNHLYETPLNALKSKEVFGRYVEIAARLHSLLREGGTLIATDACRYSFWTQVRRFGWPKFLCLTQQTIEWQIHQQPKVWRKIFLQAGFRDVHIQYPVPYRLRWCSPIANTAFVNWMLHGGFILHATK